MSDIAVGIDPDLNAIVSNLHQTVDAIQPAVRMEADRRHIQFIAGSSVKLNFILATALVLSLVGNLAFGWFAVHPDREYFASDNGRLFPMIPMSRPYRKPADVIQFAKDTVTRSFTLDFLDYRQQLEDVRGKYTTNGFQSLNATLRAQGILKMVQDRRMNMSVTAGTGVLTKMGVEDGIFVWYVQMPIEVKLAGQTSELAPQKFLATVVIKRIPTLDSIEGIGTDALTTSPL
ncbi:Macrophage killing protein with similarity to conjugation protein [Burkholderia diffusa]|uniref:DotI/IcmL family type IV secretion protein n=1 Tax=Burkholderia diffusa TaxID=488732 RepID=UPI001CB48746|nr:DotI/IcmL family type IV secretion protein [Burkholderia diffusa]CAG9260882.1 Macrophage killing protein with similarity to conjugation protein [Burkholderia diffusa]